MNSSELARAILRRLTPGEQRDVLDEVGLREKQRASPDFSVEEIRSLLFPLLRRTHLSDEEFKRLTQEVGIIPSASGRSSTLLVDVPLANEYAASRMPLNELTAASILVWQVAHRIAHVIDALEIPVDLAPPEVRSVQASSISFSLSGSSLLLGGIGLIILAYTALPLGVAADFAYAGGSIAAVMGVVDSVINWRKTIKETSKIDSDTKLNEVNMRKQELEIEKLRKELEPKPASTPPASLLVPSEIVVYQSRHLGIDPAIAAQMINEALPAYAVLASNYKSSPTATVGGGASAASAR